jgi:RNA polymerase sigma-70 factor (ECF subfamily)
MSFPPREDELELHERVLRKEEDPVAPADVFQAFMEPLMKVLQCEMACSEDDAHDAATDAVLDYLRNPERYDRQQARLSTYLTQAAKRNVRDKQRATASRVRNEQGFLSIIEVQAPAPKERLEVSVEARLAVERLEGARLTPKQREFLKLVLQGERSTQRLAEVLGLASLPKDELRKEVKRQRDRLMKMLGRLGKEEPDDES